MWQTSQEIQLRKLPAEQLLISFLVDHDFGLCDEAVVTDRSLQRAITLDCLAKSQPKGIQRDGTLASVTFPERTRSELASNLLPLLPERRELEYQLSVDLCLTLTTWGGAVDDVKRVHAQALQEIDKQKKIVRAAARQLSDIGGEAGLSFNPDICLGGISREQLLPEATAGYERTKAHLHTLWSALGKNNEMRMVGDSRAIIIAMLIDSNLIMRAR